MDGKQAAEKSRYGAALRFHEGQIMIYNSTSKRMFVQTNDSFEMPRFEEIKPELVQHLLSCEDWEAWGEGLN